MTSCGWPERSTYLGQVQGPLVCGRAREAMVRGWFLVTIIRGY